MTADTLAEIAARLGGAIEAVQDLADAPAGPGENTTAMSIRMIRLAGKVEGLKLALSYVEETQRTNPTSGSATAAMYQDIQWQRALEMYGADAEHSGCDEGGCNACILEDFRRIIWGVDASRAGGNPS